MEGGKRRRRVTMVTMLRGMGFVFLLALLATGGRTLAAELSSELEGFESINFCLPITLLVETADEGAPTLLIEGDDSVVDSIKPSVVDGQLVIGMSGKFTTEKAIRATVIVPNGSLKRVENTGAGAIVVGPGLVADELAVVNTGTGFIYGNGMTVTALKVRSIGAGSVAIVLEGSFDTAEVLLSGINNVFVLGVNDRAEVTVTGIGTVYVGGGPDTTIGIDANGVTGSARVMGFECPPERSSRFGSSFGFSFSFTLLSRCGIFTENDIPDPQVEWTCGVSVDGDTQCLSGASGSGSSAFASASGGGSAVASTSGGNNADTVTAVFAACTEEGELRILN